MTVESERTAMAASVTARRARSELEAAEVRARDAVIAFVDAALTAGWTWDRIAAELGISSTAVRRYYQRNRRRTHGGDI